MRVVSVCLVFMLRVYQSALSPMLGYNKCRFYPSCSEYAVQAVERYGPMLGLALASARLMKCGPWHEGGFDPLPEPEEIASRKWMGKLLKVRG